MRLKHQRVGLRAWLLTLLAWVAFVWPDGARREESVEVGTAGPAYVMGRRE